MIRITSSTVQFTNSNQFELTKVASGGDLNEKYYFLYFNEKYYLYILDLLIIRAFHYFG